MSMFHVSSGVLVGPKAVKAVTIKVRLQDGDIEFAMVVPPDAARTIANGILKTADEADNKIIKPVFDSVHTVGES